MNFKNLSFSGKLFISYGLLIFITCIEGFIAIQQIEELSHTTERFYSHPFSLNKAIDKVESSILEIKIKMLEISHAKSQTEIDGFVANIVEKKKEIAQSLSMLNQRFSGDKKALKQLQRLNREWTDIRLEVVKQRTIELVNNPDKIYLEKSVPLIKDLFKKLDQLTTFAEGKAIEFSRQQDYQLAQSQEELLRKFYRHPYTVSLATMRVRGLLLEFDSLTNQLCHAQYLNDLDNIHKKIIEKSKKLSADTELIRERFLGDQQLIEQAIEIFRRWPPLQETIFQQRKAQLIADPAAIASKKGAPIFAKLLGVINEIKVYEEDTALQYKESAQKASNSTVTLLSILYALGTLAAIIVATLVSRAIINPLEKAVNFSQEIANQDLTAKLDIHQRDEIGVLAHSLNQMSCNLRNIFTEVANSSEIVDSASTTLEKSSHQMAKSADETAKKVDTIYHATEDVNSNMASVSAASNQASGNVTMVASATEEMSATIKEIALSSENAQQITNNAVSQSQKASQQIGELNKSAREISKVTETITEISEQTNLLALNATIEAARAGEAGKGFAVVANEIKALARQTAEATGEIRNQILAIQSASHTSVDNINEVSEVIAEVNQIVKSVSLAVEEQANATQEIASNVGQAAIGMDEVGRHVSSATQAIQQIAHDMNDVDKATKEIASGSKQNNGDAVQLKQLSSQINQLIGGFTL